MPAAIVIVEVEGAMKKISDLAPSPSWTGRSSQIGSFACVEILGNPILGRTVESLLRGGVERLTVLSNMMGAIVDRKELPRMKVCFSLDVWADAALQLAKASANGTDVVLILRVGPYVEFDVADAVQFHRESGEAVSRAFDDHGPLDFWIVDPARVRDAEEISVRLHSSHCAYYRIGGYVNRLEHPRDLRRLVADSLNSRCQLRPDGLEVRPGIWMGKGAQVEKSARIVAPAYVGRGTTIAGQCLITRCSNVEFASHVDYGTVVEDTSVLPNSYIGIGLEVSHSLVDGNTLLNLPRGVMVTIADPVVMRHINPLPENNQPTVGRPRTGQTRLALAGNRNKQ